MKFWKVFAVLSGALLLIVFGILGLWLYGAVLDSNLRQNVEKVKPGMTEHEVIAILGKPSSRSMSDGSGLYWWYRTDYPFALIDDDPNNVGYVVLRSGYDGNVIEVFLIH